MRLKVGEKLNASAARCPGMRTPFWIICAYNYGCSPGMYELLFALFVANDFFVVSVDVPLLTFPEVPGCQDGPDGIPGMSRTSFCLAPYLNS